MMKVQAIIAAAGMGTRFLSTTPKTLVTLSGLSLFLYSVIACEQSAAVTSTIVVAPPESRPLFEKALVSRTWRTPVKVVDGGSERFASVHNGLTATDADTDIVLIHDGARPLVTTACIDEAIALCAKKEAVVVAVPVKNTIKRVDEKTLMVEATLRRSELWEIQTPQVFKRDLLLRAYREVVMDARITDDAMLVEHLGVPVAIVRGEYTNIKVTTPDDMIIAEAFVAAGLPQ